MYQWLVFLHVLGALGFMLAHGATSFITFALPHQRDPERIKSWLFLARSKPVYGMMYISLLLLLGTGIWAGLSGDWWGSWWIWLSLGLLLVIGIVMGFIGRGYLDRVSAAVGINPGSEPVGQAELEAVLAKSPAALLAISGLGGITLILWLMMFKPF